MSSTGVNGILSLPTELILTVFHSIDSPRDLFSLVRCNSPIYGIFKHHKLAVLDGMAQRAFSYGSLSNALKICEVSRPIQDIRYGREPLECYNVSEETAEELQEFMKHHEPKLQQILSSPLEINLIVSLCRLWYVVDYFVYEYSGKTLPKIWLKTDDELVRAENKALDRAQCLLSRAEYSRLQRAFLKLELNLMVQLILEHGIEKYVDMGDMGYPALLAKFLEIPTPWDCIELLSVRSWLNTAVFDYLDNLEDVFFDSVPQRERELALLYFQNHTLAFHRRFLSMTKRDATLVAVCCDQVDDGNQFNRNGLLELGDVYMSIYSQHDEYLRMLETSINIDLDTFVDTPLEPNLGWHWVQGANVTQGTGTGTGTLKPGSEKVAPNLIPLRRLPQFTWSCTLSRTTSEISSLRLYNDLIADWGYIFWDASRLMQPGVLAPSPPDLESDLPPADNDDNGDLDWDPEWGLDSDGEEGEDNLARKLICDRLQNMKKRLSKDQDLDDFEEARSVRKWQAATSNMLSHRDPIMHKRLLKEWDEPIEILPPDAVLQHRGERLKRQAVAKEFRAMARPRADELLGDLKCYW